MNPRSAAVVVVVAIACTTGGGVRRAGDRADGPNQNVSCAPLRDPALARGTSFPPIPIVRPVVAYPQVLGDRPWTGDSAKITIVVDSTGAVPECAVKVLSVSDSLLLPYVAPSAATLRFQPARTRGGPAASRLTMILRFDTPERVRAAAERTPRRIDVVVEQPPVLDPGSPMPRYPDDLLAQRLRGRVVITATVTPEGRIDLTTVRVVSSDHPQFTAAVRGILSGLRFAPARRGVGGPPVASQVQVPFDFIPP